MNEIKTIRGNATNVKANGNIIIVHICNDEGIWDTDFEKLLSKRWIEPEKSYLRWHKSNIGFGLSEVQLVPVEPDIWVANAIAKQRVQPNADGKPSLRFAALSDVLQQVCCIAKRLNASVHIPKREVGVESVWEYGASIVNRELCKNGVAVTVYEK